MVPMHVGKRGGCSGSEGLELGLWSLSGAWILNLKNAPPVSKSCEILGRLQVFICDYLQNRTFLPALAPGTAAFRSSEPPPGRFCGGDNLWGAARHYGLRGW